jgi:hypothetical protein
MRSTENPIRTALEIIDISFCNTTAGARGLVSHPPDGTSTAKRRMIIFRRGLSPWEVSLWQDWPAGGISFTQTLSAVCSGSLFILLLFSTTWPGSFLGLFFQQERIFNNFPASFLGSFGFVFWTDLLLSITSRVRFLKNVFFVPHNFGAKVLFLFFQWLTAIFKVCPDCLFPPQPTRPP